MLRAMYDFQAPYENTLTFSENDLFVVLKRNNKDRDWVHVISLAGENGYAPANYLTVANCSKSEEIKFIDEILAQLASKRAPSRDQPSVVENLLECRSQLENEMEGLAAKQMYELASLIRQTTKCTFQQAQGAVFETLKYFQENVLPIPNGIGRILKTDFDTISLEIRKSCGVDSQHIERLAAVIMEFASDQETDVSEESWNEFLDLITHADHALLIAALNRHDCALILQLVHRLQAETSWTKRKPILVILFHALQLSTTFVNVAINSILPSELARDIQTTFAIQDTNKDRVYWSIKVLTVTLCCKEPLSFAQQSELGDNLIELVVNTLEEESVSIATTNERDDGSLASSVMNLILALYRQFRVVSQENNPVLLCLAKRTMCESLIEKTILLYNREDDPIKEYLRDDGNDLTDTISSFMLGLFSGPETAKLFYTADLAVLLDVILRRLTDYGPGDKRRSDALQLFYAIQRSLSPSYKKQEFAKCLKGIIEESSRLGSPTSDMEQDHQKITRIFHEFPDLMKTI